MKKLTLKDLLTVNNLDEFRKLSSDEHLELMTSSESEDVIKAKVMNKKEIANFAKYFLCVPDELKIKVFNLFACDESDIARQNLTNFSKHRFIYKNEEMNVGYCLVLTYKKMDEQRKVDRAKDLKHLCNNCNHARYKNASDQWDKDASYHYCNKTNCNIDCDVKNCGNYEERD